MGHTKCVVITGGANGIGRCIAETFLRQGDKVFIIDIDEKAEEDLKAHYNQLNVFIGDISEKKVLEDFVKTLDESVDILINNACISKQGLLSECSWEDFEYVQKVGVIAPYYLTKLLYDGGRFAEGASVLNLSSTRAYQSQPNTESYSAAKGGILSLTHAMAISLSGKVRVNSISPGWIDTAPYHEGKAPMENTSADKKQHPVRRVGTPEDVAGLVQYLSSDQASFITGQDFTIDGGMSRLMIYHDDLGWQYEG